MIKTIMSAAVALGVAMTITTSPVQAQNFDRLEMFTVVSSGDLEFRIDGNTRTGVTGLEAGIHAFHHKLDSEVFGSVFFTVGKDTVSNELTAGAEYRIAYMPGDFSVYGGLGVEYRTVNTKLNGGDVVVTPRIGVGYNVTPEAFVFGEVQNSWTANNSWANRGALAEIGLEYSVNDNVAVIPSIVHQFNTPGVKNNTQARVGVHFRF